MKLEIYGEEAGEETVRLRLVQAGEGEIRLEEVREDGERVPFSSLLVIREEGIYPVVGYCGNLPVNLAGKVVILN